MSMRPPASRRVRTPAIALALLVIVQSGPGGLWILSWRGKRARYARCRLTPCRRRVSHNTLDAADGAHRLHRHFRRTLDQDVKIGSRRPVTLRHRKEGTDRASSLRSDERSRSPESAFTFAEIGVHVQRNTHHFSNIRRFFGGSVFGVAGGSIPDVGVAGGSEAAASARHRRPPRPNRRPPPGCVDRGVLAGACASTPGPVGAAPVRARSHSSAGLRAMRGRLWHQRRRPRPPHTAPGRGERRCEPRLASLNSPATAGPCWAPHRHGGSVGPCDLDRWWHPTRPRRHVPRTSSSLLRPSQRHLPSQGTVPKRRANVQGGGGDDRSVRAP